MAASRSLRALARRLRIMTRIAAKARPKPTATPTAIPAMAPVPILEDEEEARVYLKLNS